MPTDGISAARGGAETSLRRRFFDSSRWRWGAERKAQGERPRDYKIFARSGRPGIESLLSARRGLKRGSTSPQCPAGYIRRRPVWPKLTVIDLDAEAFARFSW